MLSRTSLLATTAAKSAHVCSKNFHRYGNEPAAVALQITCLQLADVTGWHKNWIEKLSSCHDRPTFVILISAESLKMKNFGSALLLWLTLVVSIAAQAEVSTSQNPFTRNSFWKTQNAANTYVENSVTKQKDAACNAVLAILTPVCAQSRPQIEIYGGFCTGGIARSFELRNGQIFILNQDCTIASSTPVGSYDDSKLSFTFAADDSATDRYATKFSIDFGSTKTSGTFNLEKTGTFMQADGSQTTESTNQLGLLVKLQND